MDNRILFFKSMVEKANLKGSYALEESYILKTCFDNYGSDMNKNIEYINLIIQSLQKGQGHGSFTLEESSRIFSVIKDCQTNPPKPTQLTQQTPELVQASSDSSDLTEPLPLN